MREDFAIRFRSRAADLDQAIAASDLPAASIEYLVQYGTRWLNDGVNSAAKTAKDAGESFDAAEHAAKMLARLRAGEVGARGGGGGSLSDMERAVREVLARQFRRHMKAGEADKAAKADGRFGALAALIDAPADKVEAAVIKKAEALVAEWSDDLPDLD